MEWYVGKIGDKFVNKNRMYFWWTTDVNEAEKFRTAIDAEKGCVTIIGSSGFPVDALLPLINLKIVRLTVEDVPMGNPSPDDKASEPKADSYPIPQNLGC